MHLGYDYKQAIDKATKLYITKLDNITIMKEDEFKSVEGQCGYTETCNINNLRYAITHHMSNNGIIIKKCNTCGYIGFHRARHEGGCNIKWIHFAEGVLELWRDLEHDKNVEEIKKQDIKDPNKSEKRKRSL